MTLDTLDTNVENGQAPATPKPQPQTVTISLPDVITADTWLSYVRGRNEFNKANPDIAFGTLSDYAGACAVINAGIVKITCSDEMREIIRRTRIYGVDMAVIGWLTKNVSTPIEAAIHGPLSDSMKPLSER